MPKIIHFESETQFLGAMYKKKFEEAGFEYLLFGFPPKNLVEMVSKEKPDLIIMSIIMPEMDGFTATKWLKEDLRTKNIPIFGLTNMGQQKDIEQGLSLGMEKYLVNAKNPPQEVIEQVKKRLKA